MPNLITFCLSLVLTGTLSLGLISDLQASVKRTDGPEGSEYGDFSRWDGEFQVGLEFGALLNSNSKRNAFALGLDLDYRPADLFGLRVSGFHGFKTPRTSTVLMTPLIHYEFSNLHPYFLAGPGIAIINRGGSEAKFDIAMGAGADVRLFGQAQLGLLWIYNMVFDHIDHHIIGARISYVF